MLGLASLVGSGCSVSDEMRSNLGLVEPRAAKSTDGASLPPGSTLMAEEDANRLFTLAAGRDGTSVKNDYKIGPDDLLDVRIPDLLEGATPATTGRAATSGGSSPAVMAGAPTYQGGERVTADGTITVPLVGEVRAEGLTGDELEAEIARQLVSRGLLRHPTVNVQIIEYRSRVIAVVGSVERPGQYPLTRPRATLADMIWTAGGPTKDAGRIVEISPAGNRTGRPIHVDLELLLHQSSPAGGVPSRFNPEVRPGDTISLSPAGSVLVHGWVDKPGSYPVTRGLTLTGAVAAAGGQSYAADRQAVTVKRVMGPGDDKVFLVDLDAITKGESPDMPIADGDVIHVPAATAKVIPWGIWTVGKEMIRIGGNVVLF